MRSQLQTAETIASDLGEDFFLTLARWLSGFTPELCLSLRSLAHKNGQRYADALAILMHAQIEVDGDPVVGLALLETPEALRPGRTATWPTPPDRSERSASSSPAG
jgi:hypothetical protein